MTLKHPFNVMRHADWDAAPRMPQAIGAAIAAVFPATTAAAFTFAVGGVATSVSYAAILGYVAYSALTSAALRSLAPKAAAQNKGTLINSREAAAPQEYVYGQVRKGGVITFLEASGGNNKYLHMILTLAGHEVEEIGSVYINDEVVSIDSNGFVTGDRWKSKVRIYKHLGNQTSASTNFANASTNLAATLHKDTSATSSFIGKGIAYIYARFKHDQDVFSGGLPTITAVVKGKKVYDPRTATTAYSNNAALCVRDYLTSAYGLNDSAVDDTYFSAAANDCDDNITLASGGTQKRYTVDGVINSSSAVGAALADMLDALNGTLFFSGGAWKLKAGVYEASVKSLTLDDFRSAITLPTRLSRRDNFNRVTGKFIYGGVYNKTSNPNAGDWIEADFPAIESSAFLAEDNSIDNTLDISLAMVTNEARAQRIAKQKLFRSREQMTVSAEFGLAAMGVEVGDIVDLTIDRYGWTNKEFEVVNWRLVISDNGGVRVAMTLRETSSAAFAWNAEETAVIQNNSNLPRYYEVSAPGVSLSGALRLVNEQVVGALLIDVQSGDDTTDQFDVQYRKTGDTNWISLGRSSSNRFEAVGISDGSFDARARMITSLGVRSPWTTVSSFYVTLFATPPANVTNFSANVVGNTVHLTWTPVADLDLSHYKIRYSSATSGASYQNAVDLVKKVSRPANSVVVPAQTGTYFIKAIDKLGKVSASPASIVVTTNTADIDALNVIETLTQDPTFAGTKTDVVVLSDDTGNYLTLDTSTLFDAVSGDFDDAVGLFDGGGATGQLVSSGTYEFENYIDLGQKFISRVSTDLNIAFLDYAETFDAADGLFDDREGDFDGDPAQFDTISARTQVSHTDDDPAGTPTWTAWRDFIVGDIAARAIRFRAILETTDANNAPAVRGLAAIVDMPDRVEAQNDLTYTGSQSVTFPAAFKATPAIGIAATLADGDRYVISSKSRTGFTITTYTGGSVSANSATIDYVAKGYGKELA